MLSDPVNHVCKLDTKACIVMGKSMNKPATKIGFLILQGLKNYLARKDTISSYFFLGGGQWCHWIRTMVCTEQVLEDTGMKEVSRPEISSLSGLVVENAEVQSYTVL